MTTTDTTTDGTVCERLRTSLGLIALATFGLAAILWTAPARADGTNAGTADRQTVVVPEPATLAYVAVTAATLFRRRRGKKTGQGRM